MRPGYAFFISAICGYLLWEFSGTIFSHREPWDADLFLYLLLLAVIGAVSVLITKGSPTISYWGAYAGQAAFLLSTKSNLLPLGLAALFVYSLPAWMGAWLVYRTQKTL